MTFDLDLWPTDLNINRGHLLIKEYLPTKFEASGAKRSWVISCTRWSRLAWPLTLTFDLLTWISIGVIYSSRTINLPSLKLLGQSCSWVISCTRWRRLTWSLTLTFYLLTWISIGAGNTLDLWRDGPSKWASGPSLNKMYIKLAKTGGHQGKWRGRWTLIWGPRPKLTAYLDRLYRGPFHIWSRISSILHSFLINWQWPIPGLSL